MIQHQIKTNELSYDFSKKPILIVGSRRSGTSLLGRMLNAHPKISIPYIQTGIIRYSDARFMPFSQKNIENLFETIIFNRTTAGSPISNKQKESIINFLQTNGFSLQNLYYAFALFVFKAKPTHRWGEKYAADCRDVDYFFQLFPDGQVIHIIRDIRDVYASSKKRLLLDSNLLHPFNRHLTIIDEWKQCFCRSKKNLQKYGSNSYFILQYEDLVNDVEKITKHLCKFLSVDWNFDMINTEKFKDDQGKNWSTNSSFETMSKITTSAVGRFKNLFNNELAYVEKLTKTEIIDMNHTLYTNQSDFHDKKHLERKRTIARIIQQAFNVALFLSSNDKRSLDLINFLHQHIISHENMGYHLTVFSPKEFNLSSKFPNVNFVDCNSNELNSQIYENNIDLVHIHGKQTFNPDDFLQLKQNTDLKIILSEISFLDPNLFKLGDAIILNNLNEKQILVKHRTTHRVFNSSDFFSDIPTIYRETLNVKKLVIKQALHTCFKNPRYAKIIIKNLISNPKSVLNYLNKF